MIINTITSREDRATITAIIGVSSLLSFESELPAGGKVSGVVAAVLEFPSQSSVLASVNRLSISHVPFGEMVVPPEFVPTALLVPLSEREEFTVVTEVGSRVRFGLNVGASEREITEEVGFEVLFSSLTDSVVDVLINLVIPKEGETVVVLLALTRIRPLPNRRRMNQESMLTEPGAGRDRGGRARRLRLSTAAASRAAAALRAAARSAARSPAAAAAASPPWRGEAARGGLGGRLRWRRGPEGPRSDGPAESLSAPRSPQPRSRRGLGCKALRHWPLRDGRWFADAGRASPPPRAPPLRAGLRPGVPWRPGGSRVT